MTPAQIAARLGRIESEENLCVRAQRVAVLVAERFRELGYETAVVGGSAIEFYTSGEYMSGDVDLAFVGRTRPEPRVIAEAMLAALPAYRVEQELERLLGEARAAIEP